MHLVFQIQKSFVDVRAWCRITLEHLNKHVNRFENSDAFVKVINKVWIGDNLLDLGGLLSLLRVGFSYKIALGYYPV
jgi:hypothetical protein